MEFVEKAHGLVRGRWNEMRCGFEYKGEPVYSFPPTDQPANKYTQKLPTPHILPVPFPSIQPVMCPFINIYRYYASVYTTQGEGLRTISTSHPNVLITISHPIPSRSQDAIPSHFPAQRKFLIIHGPSFVRKQKLLSIERKTLVQKTNK